MVQNSKVYYSKTCTNVDGIMILILYEYDSTALELRRDKKLYGAV